MLAFLRKNLALGLVYTELILELLSEASKAFLLIISTNLPKLSRFLQKSFSRPI